MNRFTSNLIRALAISTIATCAARADVTTTLSKGKLKITGDATGRVIDLKGAGFGALTMTVDGVPAGDFLGVRDIDVKCGSGDDTLNVLAIQIGGNLRAKMGDGNDIVLLAATDSPTGKPLVLCGKVDVDLGGDAADAIGIAPIATNSVYLMSDVTIRGAPFIGIDGGGSSPTLEASDIVIGGKLRTVRVGGDPGQLELTKLDDVLVGGETRLEFGNAKDELLITQSQFARKVTMRLRGGDDTVDFQNDATKFDGPVSVIGGSGFDSLVNTAGCEFAAAFAFPQMEFVP
ncbi:MAG: hypothetical protein IPH13_05570 [Planctomycetes bacterium]|nr:hypothetical protein [Planctomycetota bacterium]